MVATAPQLTPPLTAPGNSLSDALAVICKGVAAARDAVTFETDPSVLGDALCELAGLQSEIDSLRIGLADQARTNGVPQSIGVRTVGQYVAARTNQSATRTNMDATMSKWLWQYAKFAAALETREMTVAHLNYVRNKLDNARTCLTLRADQHLLVDAARTCGFEDFKHVCDYWLNRIDPSGEEPKDQIESHDLRFRKGPGGRIIITGQADAITGQALQTAVQHEAEKLRHEDLAAGLAIRTEGQRNLAALANLVARGFKRDDGSYPVPLINIVMSQSVLEWTQRQQDNPSGEPVPVDPFDVDGRCELIDGTPVHPTLVLMMTGLFKFELPTLRRYVLDANSRIIDYSVNARTHPEYMRTATHVQARGSCDVPGCDAPFHWLQMDHVQPNSRGGPTNLTNTQPLCRPDNYAKSDTPNQTAHHKRPPPPRYESPNQRPHTQRE